MEQNNSAKAASASSTDATANETSSPYNKEPPTKKPVPSKVQSNSCPEVQATVSLDTVAVASLEPHAAPAAVLSTLSNSNEPHVERVASLCEAPPMFQPTRTDTPAGTPLAARAQADLLAELDRERVRDEPADAFSEFERVGLHVADVHQLEFHKFSDLIWALVYARDISDELEKAKCAFYIYGYSISLVFFLVFAYVSTECTYVFKYFVQYVLPCLLFLPTRDFALFLRARTERLDSVIEFHLLASSALDQLAAYRSTGSAGDFTSSLAPIAGSPPDA